MRRTAALLILFGLIILAAGLILFPGIFPPGSAARLPQTVSAAEGHGFDLADLDTTCKPCEDFFRYATGGWIKRNPIQPEYASWGRFNALQNHNQDVLRQILEADAGGPDEQ